MTADAFDEMVTVVVCAKCGKGIPPWSDEMLSVGIDNQPIWFTTTQREDFCNGRLIIVERQAQIERVEIEEFMRGEQWTEEQFAKMRLNQTETIRTIGDERNAGGHAGGSECGSAEDESGGAGE
jgi:hypothetical protein